MKVDNMNCTTNNTSSILFVRLVRRERLYRSLSLTNSSLRRRPTPPPSSAAATATAAAAVPCQRLSSTLSPSSFSLKDESENVRQTGFNPRRPSSSSSLRSTLSPSSSRLSRHSQRVDDCGVGDNANTGDASSSTAVSSPSPISIRTNRQAD